MDDTLLEIMRFLEENKMTHAVEAIEHQASFPYNLCTNSLEI